MASLSTIDIERLKASQYLSAIGLVILLWNHVLTFADEVELIWTARSSIPKVLFLFNRYAVPCAMIFELHLGRQHKYPLPCKAWTAIAVIVGMLSVATSNFMVLLRLWVLWDRPPRLMLVTLIFYVVTQFTSMGCAGYVIYEMLPTMHFDPVLRICIPMTKPKFLLLWSPGIAFELMVFLTTVWNALDRPRAGNSEMARVMYRDGSAYFFGLFTLRLINMVISLTAPFSLFFLGVFFIWSVCNITLADLIFNLRRLSRNAGDGDGDLDEPAGDDAEEDYVEHIELPVLRGAYGGSRGRWKPQDKVLL